jgi:hypothetical protein
MHSGKDGSWVVVVDAREYPYPDHLPQQEEKILFGIVENYNLGFRMQIIS